MDMKVLLCSDMDRTLLPNGSQPESGQALELFRRVAGQPELILAYVTGRNRKLIEEAIETYQLPVPDYAVGDVGATIYRIENGRWTVWDDWSRKIAPDWNGREASHIASLFEDISDLTPQGPENQSPFKLSYYAPEKADYREMRRQMQSRLKQENIRASLIWSVDEAEHKGLMDVLPERATKYHAVRFIMQHHAVPERYTVFAGDSGNDMPALTSGLQAVLVRNANTQVRSEALRDMQAQGLTDLLYIAEGNFLDMNGNYAAGVLEGLAHFIPETRKWMEAAR